MPRVSQDTVDLSFSNDDAAGYFKHVEPIPDEVLTVLDFEKYLEGSETQIGGRHDRGDSSSSLCKSLACFVNEVP